MSKRLESTLARVAVFIVLLLVPAWVQAQKPGSPRALAQAKVHYKQGEKHYQIGEFDKAVLEYREAYRLSDRPELLFNIAQAYRLAEDAEQALYFYRGYLRRLPEARNRADVQELIKTMETVAAEQKRRKRELGEIDERRREVEMARLDAAKKENRGRRGLRLAGIGTGAAGLLALGGGMFFALSARSDWQNINDLSDDGGRWTPNFQDRYESAETKETLSAVFFATGGAAVVAGGLMYWFGRDKKPTERSLTVAPGPGSLTVVGWF